MSDDLPFRHRVDLGRLSQAGAEVAIVVRGEELARLALWADVDAVNGFAASVVLSRLSQTRFTLDAELRADIVQSCVVTLEPVASHIALHIVRELHYSPRRHAESGELALSPGDEDAPEEIASLDYDLAAPLLEDFVLAIDPYPRKEGVAFDTPMAEPEAPPSPFAVLKRLKDRG